MCEFNTLAVAWRKQMRHKVFMSGEYSGVARWSILPFGRAKLAIITVSHLFPDCSFIFNWQILLRGVKDSRILSCYSHRQLLQDLQAGQALIGIKMHTDKSVQSHWWWRTVLVVCHPKHSYNFKSIPLRLKPSEAENSFLLRCLPDQDKSDLASWCHKSLVCLWHFSTKMSHLDFDCYC